MFIEKVDFVSGPGHPSDPEILANRPKWATGPQVCVTPLAVMDFNTPDQRMRLRSVHPGHTVDEAREKTGFDLVCDGDIPETPGPTDEELRIIREEIDTDGVLPGLIP